MLGTHDEDLSPTDFEDGGRLNPVPPGAAGGAVHLRTQLPGPSGRASDATTHVLFCAPLTSEFQCAPHKFGTSSPRAPSLDPSSCRPHLSNPRPFLGALLMLPRCPKMPGGVRARLLVAKAVGREVLCAPARAAGAPRSG